MTTSKNDNINHETLKYFREMKGLTQVDLAKKMKVDKDTVYRWESGQQKIRLGNQNKLAKELGVHLNKLRQPLGKVNEVQEVSDSKTKITLSESTKLALELVSETYHVSPNSIIDFAPFMFHMVAAASLGNRVHKIDEVEAVLSNTTELCQSTIPHMPNGFWDVLRPQDNELYEERAAIENNQLFDLGVGSNYDDSDTFTENPFSQFLKTFINLIPENLNDLFEIEWRIDELPRYHISDSFFRDVIKVPVKQDLFEQIKELILNGRVKKEKFGFLSDKLIEEHKDRILEEVSEYISEEYKKYTISKSIVTGEER